MLRHIRCAAFLAGAVVFGVGMVGASEPLATATLDKSWTRQANGSWTLVYDSQAGDIRAVGANGEVYSNVTTFSGSGFAQGPTTGTGPTITRLVADDITMDPAAPVGTDIRRVTFSVFNGNTASVSFRPRTRFWNNDGAGGNPGTTPYGGASFNPITIAANTISTFFYDPGAGALTIPANRQIWAAETFDNLAPSTATDAQMQNVGQGLWNPPTIGSSADTAFETTTGGSFFGTANPPGAQFNFSGNPVANFGWELRVNVPEPGSMMLAGIGLAGLAARRRRA